MGRKKSKTSVVTRTTLPKIEDLDTYKNQGIVLINQKTIEDLYAKSGKTAISNEFQTHYWALNFRHKAEDGSILDVSIPTVYFNYKQEVSGSEIDFDLKEVKEISAKLEPIHNMKANELLKLGIKDQLEEALGGTALESSPSDFNSIHRHPGSSRSQSFSPTDLTADANEPGVVFPLATAKETPNFAGIMAIDNTINNVAHYEYRVATGTLGTDITYTKGRCAAIVVKPETSISIVEQLIGIEKKEESYVKYDDCEYSTIIGKIFQAAKTIYLEHGFEAFTDSVIAENLTEKRSTYGSYYGNYYGNNYSNNYSNSEKEKYENKLISFQEEKDLLEQYPYQLNDTYKALSIQSGKSAPTWCTNIKELTRDILDLQAKLGYTKDTPYGSKGIRYPFKTNTEYQNTAVYTLRSHYKELLAYFDMPVTQSKINTATKTELLEWFETLQDYYENILAPLYEVEEEEEKPKPPKDVIDAKEFIENCKDLEMFDLEENVYSLTQLKEQVSTLMDASGYTEQEVCIFGDLKFHSLEDGIDIVDGLQMSIKIDISLCKQTIEDYEAEHKTVNVVEPTIQEMKDELICCNVVPNIVNTSSDEKIKSLYKRIVLIEPED